MIQRRFALKKTLFLLPNMITLSSVFCGFFSIHVSAAASQEDDFYRSALLIVFAMFFDALDGRVARMTKTQTAFGLQLDSLADIVSFGCAPALLVYTWALYRLSALGLVAAFAFVACGAVRLARFNVLAMAEAGKVAKPSKYIVGLPIPGAAGILVSIVVANHAVAGVLASQEYVWAIFAVTTALSALMVSTIRFRSFKDIQLNARAALFATFAVGSSVVISTQLKSAFVLVWLLGCYVLLGICESLWHLSERARRHVIVGHGGSSVPDRSKPSSRPPPG